ncbi:MAG TPA: hypothetical protein VLX92_08370 [Kofleriaceae bacterium]|nr:hypothetical protein [Kofleriaceae bacterium]
MMKPVLALLVGIGLSACTAEANMSSLSYLGPQQSSGESPRDVTTAAREVTRLLEVRGYQMIDQHSDAPGGGLTLKFEKSDRALAATKVDQPVGARDIGSVFYAWITPTGPSSSLIKLLGKPTINGAEPCTNDNVVQACTRVILDQDFVQTFMSGQDEAEVAHGVLSELSLEGFVTAPGPGADPQAVAAASARSACEAKASQVAEVADRENDLDKRAEILKTAPDCSKL